jgi:hypothetical protein
MSNHVVVANCLNDPSPHLYKENPRWHYACAIESSHANIITLGGSLMGNEANQIGAQQHQTLLLFQQNHWEGMP